MSNRPIKIIEYESFEDTIGEEINADDEVRKVRVDDIAEPDLVHRTIKEKIKEKQEEREEKRKIEAEEVRKGKGKPKEEKETGEEEEETGETGGKPPKDPK